MPKFNTNKNFENIVFDLLVDILATNHNILDKINSFSDFDNHLNKNDNRVQIIEYLNDKYGSLPETISKILKNNGINES